MRLAFIDDSQQREPPRDGLGHLLAIGAVIVPDDQVAGFAEDLRRIRDELGMPAGEEIKWAPAKGTFLKSAPVAAISRLRTGMLEAAQRRGVKSVVVIVDHDRAYRQKSQAEIGVIMLKWLYERISMHLRDREVDDIGMIIADKPGGGSAQESKWLAASLELTDYGTEYVSPERIVLPIVTAHSHHVPHLQLADLVVAATTAAYAGRRSGLDLVPLLRPMMHRHRLGHVNGAGIVQFPELVNLYYWAFGETAWAKPSANAGWELPRQGEVYFDEDGLS
ncbi:MAG: DUF3800 domain-containing protein [Actinophytocola sp.]|uniref:DUF3800 domain-containing protein n=1 Tax=Actinophytocola sp. TaxID=1872138 RepID=UPI003D6A8A9A